MALVGVQPVLTQVPPKSFRSTMATFRPALARATAREGPAWPAPTTMASKLRFIQASEGRTRESEFPRGLRRARREDLCRRARQALRGLRIRQTFPQPHPLLRRLARGRASAAKLRWWP